MEFKLPDFNNILIYYDVIVVAEDQEVATNTKDLFRLANEENPVIAYHVSLIEEALPDMSLGTLEDVLSELSENAINFIALIFLDGGTLSFHVLYDTVAPVLSIESSCPEDIFLGGVMAAESAVSWEEPIFTDGQSGLREGDPRAHFTASSDVENVPEGTPVVSPVNLLGGSYTITYTASDLAGNIATGCSFEIDLNMPPVISTCPVDMTVATAMAADNDAVITWSAPSVSDDVDTGIAATLSTAPTAGLVSGDRFPVGVTTVRYDAMDSSGNAAITCEFDVTVTQTADTTPPVIATCPVDMTVATAMAADNDAVITWSAPSVSDDVDTGLAATLSTAPTAGLVSGDRFPVGVTTVRYDAVDSSGNAAITCSFDVTVTQTADTTPPVISTCPVDMTVATAVAADNDAVVSWSAPSVSDDVDTGIAATLSTAPTAGLVSGDRFPVGVTTVSYDAVDSSGNAAITCEFDVTVTQTADTTPPVIATCPVDMTVATAVAADNDAVVSWSAPSVSDDVDTGLAATLSTAPTAGLASGDRFPVGVTTVRYDAMDSSGNAAITCEFDVTVTQTADTTPPVINNCPVDMTVATAVAADNDAVVSWSAPSVSDDVDTGLAATLSTAPTAGLASGDRFPVGVTTVRYDAMDSSGNAAITCEFDVTVTQTADTTPPVIATCPVDMTVATAMAAENDAVITWSAPSVSDDVDTGLAATLSTAPTAGLASGDRFPVGVTTVRYDAMDSSGNAAITCEFDVTVTQTADTTPPVINNCPVDMTVATAVAADNDAVVSWSAPSVSDDVDTGLAATLSTAPTAGLASGDRFPVGVTTVRYDAMDSSGNAAITCEFDVTVTQTADTTPPVIATCPVDMTVATAMAAENDAVITWSAPSVSDDVDTGITATLSTAPTAGLVSGDRFPVGVTTVRYDAVDSSGNTALTCSFDVTVTQTPDTTPPVIATCPVDMTVATAVAADNDAVVSWSAPSVSDDVDTGIAATLSTAPTAGLVSGDRFPVGVTTVRYDAVDSSGNAAITCEFDVTVTQTADTTPPVIATCPVDMTVATAMAADNDAVITWSAPSVSDDVDTGLAATLSTAPTAGLVSGDRFPVGVTTVRYDAVDSSGNAAITCSFDVTVTQTADTTPPVISTCPVDMTVATAVAADNDAVVSWSAPSVSDDVDTGIAATLSTAPTAGLVSGDRFPVGVTTVSYDAMDSSGNAAITCEFDVTVTQTADTTPPVISTCPVDMTVATAMAADNDAVVSWTSPSVSDDVDTGIAATLSTAPTAGLASGDRFPVGVTTVRYDAVDSSGNAAITCSFDVTVTQTADTTPPVIATCPVDMTVATAVAADNDAVVSWTSPSVSDDVDTGIAATLSTAPTAGLVSGDRFPVGVTTVRYDAVDSSGNAAATCEFDVTVTQTADTTPPVINNCPADMTVATAVAAENDAVITWTSPSVSDDVDTGLAATLSTAPTAGLVSGDRFPVGVTTVRYDAMDSSGNAAITCEFDVTVTQTADTTPPVIATCPVDMTVATAMAADNDAVVSWTSPSVSDDVDTGIVATLSTAPTAGLVSGDRFPIGVTTVSYDAMDSSGNAAITCEFDVTVTQTADTTPPVISTCPVDMTVATAVAADNDAVVSWSAPSVSDDVDTGIAATLSTAPTAGLVSGDRFPVGVTTVSYDAMDSSGNAAITCEFDVTVTQTADTTPPVISNCPADMTVATAVAAENDAVITWSAPSVSDDVDTGIAATLSTAPTAGLVSGDRFPVGVTTVRYDAMDSSGNAALTCSFDVTVTQTADTTPPVINNCPADMTVATAVAAENDAVITWSAPSVSDDVDTGIAATLSTAPTAGLVSGDRFPVGVTTVRYDAVDSSGNAAVTCSFDVTVTQTPDTTPPVISTCPADITVATAVAAENDAVITWSAPSVSDDVDTGIAATLSTAPTAGLVSGDRFPVGVTTVRYDAVDGAGNAAVPCSFDVTVTQTPDTTPPVISNCPADMTVVPAVLGEIETVVSWLTPSASDDVDGVINPILTTIPVGVMSGDIIPLGTVAVSYEATDNIGNTATCDFLVVVEENIEDGPGGRFKVERNNPSIPGEETNPFLIRNTNDLATLGTVVNTKLSYVYSGTSYDYNKRAYYVIRDVDLAGYNHQLIGLNSSDAEFQGIFNGQGHTFSNLNMVVYVSSQLQPVGFFGYTKGGELKNLNMVNGIVSNVNRSESTGILVGRAENTIIRSIMLSNMTLLGLGYDSGGGLVGKYFVDAPGTYLIEASSMQGGSVANYSFSGGLIGYMQMNATNGASFTIENNFVTGDILGVNGVGGLVGTIITTVTGQTNLIRNNYVTGDLSGSSTGGLIGAYYSIAMNDHLEVEGSVVTGDIIGQGASRSGGIIGEVYNLYDSGEMFFRRNVVAGNIIGTGDYMGGIFGSITAATDLRIENSYATGAFHGTLNAGGFLGRFLNNGTTGLQKTVDNYSLGGYTGNGTGAIGGFSGQDSTFLDSSRNYWDTNTSGLTISFGGTGKSSAALKTPTSATGIYSLWDGSVWDFGTSSDYPVLKGLPGPFTESYQRANFFP